MDKAAFLKNEYISLLQSIAADAPRNWGKMNVQQMVEHMEDSFQIANGKTPHELINDEATVEKMQAFIRSDKQFRENTINRLMAEEPEPVRYNSLSEAIAALKTEIDHFFAVFEKPGHTIMNPFFGLLDYELWVSLLYKHAWHHLRQFGIAYSEA